MLPNLTEGWWCSTEQILQNVALYFEVESLGNGRALERYVISMGILIKKKKLYFKMSHIVKTWKRNAVEPDDKNSLCTIHTEWG